MKIAIIADPQIPVPPKLYGGIERIIDMLINGLLKNGHEVTLFAHPDSVVKAQFYPYPKRTGKTIDEIKIAWVINRTLFNNSFDVIHSFGRLAYLLPQLPFRIPKLMSYQREPTLLQIEKAFKIAKKKSLSFTGCSNYITNQIKPIAPAFTVFNGVDLGVYDFKNEVPNDAPLIFLGRIEPIKGTHIAIEVAQKTNRKLMIAGNISPEYQSYFHEKIEPQLSDNIQYLGPVNDEQKNELLGKACALLMPIQWNEPFGIVMVEAMACGTPVIAFKRGSVPEVVKSGINGFGCDTVEQMIASVGELSTIDRQTVRRDCEERFSADVIVKEYIKIYEHLHAKT